LLDKVCTGPMISSDDLRLGGALELPPKLKKSAEKRTEPSAIRLE